MKVVHVIPYLHPSGGGPPVVADRFCQGLAQQGAQVQLVATDALSIEGEDLWRRELGQGYEVTLLPAWKRKTYGYSRGLTDAIAAAARGADFVHLHNLWGYTTIATESACRRCDVPFVISTHGMLDPHSLARKAVKKRLYGQWIEFPRIRSAAGMIYTHDEERRLAEESVPDLPPGFVVPLGVDAPCEADIPGARERLLREFPQWENRDIVLFLGRVHPKKGLDLLIPAWKQVVARHPQAHLVLSGPVDSAYARELSEQIARLDLASSVTFTGPRYAAQKWALYSLARVFVLPSYQENFAITVAEALRMGVPTLISRRVNIWSDLVPAGAARICELSAESVAEELVHILQTASLRQSLSEMGRDFAIHNYSWTAATRQLLDVYRGILRLRKGAAQEMPSAC